MPFVCAVWTNADIAIQTIVAVMLFVLLAVVMPKFALFLDEVFERSSSCKAFILVTTFMSAAWTLVGIGIFTALAARLFEFVKAFDTNEHRALTAHHDVIFNLPPTNYTLPEFFIFFSCAVVYSLCHYRIIPASLFY